MGLPFLLTGSSEQELRRYKAVAIGDGAGTIFFLILKWNDMNPQGNLSSYTVLAFLLAIIANTIFFMAGHYVLGLLIGSFAVAISIFYLMWGVAEYLLSQDNLVLDIVSYFAIALLLSVYIVIAIQNVIYFLRIQEKVIGVSYIIIATVVIFVCMLPIISI